MKVQKKSHKRVSVMLALLFCVLGITVLFYFWQLNTSNINNQTSARIFEESLINSITKYDYVPSLLAQDIQVKSLLEDESVGHQVLSQRLSDLSKQSGKSDIDIYVMNQYGTVVATSNYAEPSSFLNKNYQFRPYFSSAQSFGNTQYYFAKGFTTGVRGFFISEPIIQNGDFIGVVVVKIVLDEWEKNWQQSKQTILVADSQGVVILTSKDDWLYRAVGALSDFDRGLIEKLNQFRGETHEELYSDNFSMSMLGMVKHDIWKVDGKRYVVNQFPIKRVHWSLYHLDDQRNILSRTLWFLVFSLFSIYVLYALWNERSSRMRLRRKANEQERVRRDELQKMIDNIHIGVMVFDQSGKILSMNDHSEHLLRRGEPFNSEDELYVQALLAIDISPSQLDQNLQEDIAVPAYHETETVSLNKQHEAIPVMFSVGKIYQQHEDVYLMTIINITKRKNVEKELVLVNESLEEQVDLRTEELRKTQAQLLRKNRTTALGNMAATIVHELSQPLAAINSSVAAAQAKVERDNLQGATESIQRLKPLSTKMTNVIGLLKSYSYEDEQLISEVVFADLVNQAIDVLEDRLQTENIMVDFKNECPDSKVRVNPIKIDLAISNLLKNAMDAVEGNDPALIEVHLELSGHDRVKLTVQDNGKGVDQRIIDKLFTPYFTTKEVGRGMGLGLSITHEVVREHDGSIEVENTDKGACFCITLPLCE